MTVVDHVELQTTTTELLAAAAAGDAGSWRRLVERFEPAVHAAVVGFRLQPADAHDAVQATWLRMVEHHERIREPEALGSWLQTTARRESLRILRDGSRRDPTDVETLDAQDRSVDPEQAVVDADTVQLLDTLVDRLPARSAAVLRALFCDAPPGYAELARRTGVPIGSIGPIRGRALRKLRLLLERRGVTASGPVVSV